MFQSITPWYLQDKEYAHVFVTPSKDCLTDSVPMIEAAISSLPKEGGIIHFPAGNYVISTPIHSDRNNIYMIGVPNDHPDDPNSKCTIHSNAGTIDAFLQLFRSQHISLIGFDIVINQ